MSTTLRFVIVGAGLAAASAAGALRENGFDGGIRVIGREAHLPYIRPPLSKGYLAGAERRDKADVHKPAWYEKHDIEVTTGVSVAAIDREAQQVTLDDGSIADYSKLLLATGSSPRVPTIPGVGLPGVHTLRVVEDAALLHRQFAAGDKRVVIIGSGWIGMEVAATARSLGNEVIVLGRGGVPLANAIGEQMGRVFAQLHVDQGVELRSSVKVERIDEADDGLRVRLVGGDSVAADVVVLAIGATPDVAVAGSAGLEVDDGVLVDERLTTSDPEIFAAGDIANAMHPVIRRRLRSEHWANAERGGAAAGRFMLGLDGAYDDIPYFYTDQFDLGMEYSGYAPLTGRAELVTRGDVAAREFVAFWISDGRVVAGMNVNVWDVNEQVQRLIRDEVAVDLARLTDPDVPLEEL